MNLPEKLRNMGIQPPPTDKVKVVLTEHQIHALADVMLPTYDSKGA